MKPLPVSLIAVALLGAFAPYAPREGGPPSIVSITKDPAPRGRLFTLSEPLSGLSDPAVAVVVWAVEQSQVFQPPRLPHRSFEQTIRLMHAVPVSYRTADGIQLRGALLRAKGAGAPFVLLFYGNAELAQFEDNRLTWLQRLGFNGVCFDYRGYGYSSGTPDAVRIRNDSVALYDYVVRVLDPAHAPVFVYGVSLGTQFAIHVAAQRPVRGLLLQSPPASAQEELDAYVHQVLGVASGLLRLIPSQDVEEIFQGKREIAMTRAPLIIVHGARDTLVPIAEGREVFAAARTRDKRFIEIPDAGHGDIRFAQPPAGPAVAKFLRSHSLRRAAMNQDSVSAIKDMEVE
jgi:uncharacterized protein